MSSFFSGKLTLSLPIRLPYPQFFLLRYLAALGANHHAATDMRTDEMHTDAIRDLSGFLGALLKAQRELVSFGFTSTFEMLKELGTAPLSF